MVWQTIQCKANMSVCTFIVDCPSNVINSRDSITTPITPYTMSPQQLLFSKIIVATIYSKWMKSDSNGRQVVETNLLTHSIHASIGLKTIKIISHVGV